MELLGNSLRVLMARYLLKDSSGNVIEIPEGMFRLILSAISFSEKLYGEEPSLWEERFYELMTDLRFLPNSPLLMNTGKEMGQLATTCFVLPVEDSMISIFETFKHAAMILQSGV